LQEVFGRRPIMNILNGIKDSIVIINEPEKKSFIKYIIDLIKLIKSKK
jgi:hypothetical protein